MDLVNQSRDSCDPLRPTLPSVETVVSTNARYYSTYEKEHGICDARFGCQVMQDFHGCSKEDPDTGLSDCSLNCVTSYGIEKRV